MQIDRSLTSLSGDRFNPNSGARTIRFRIADQGFLESASCRLRFTLTNLKRDENLTAVAQVPNLFRGGRLFAASQLVEDLTDYETQAAIAGRLLPIH